jgi:hypothetical protein
MIDAVRDQLSSVKGEFVSMKFIQKNFKFTDAWHSIVDENSSLFKLLLLPELAYKQTAGKLDKLTLLCLCLLWCKDTDSINESSKDIVFKELSQTNSIKYMIEKLVRISTILVYGRLKDFGLNANTFLIDHEFDILN